MNVLWWLLLGIACRTAVGKPCPDHWFDIGTKCVYIPFDRFQPQAFAESEECRSNFSDSHLISIHSDEELNQILPLLRNTSKLARFFIGFQRSATGEWAWLDSSTPSYVHWAPEEPIINSTTNQQIYCAKIDNEGFWYSSNCRTARNFICGKPRDNTKARERGMRDIEVGLIIVGVYIPVAILVCLLVYAKSRGAFSTLAKKKQLLAQAMTRK